MLLPALLFALFRVDLSGALINCVPVSIVLALMGVAVLRDLIKRMISFDPGRSRSGSGFIIGKSVTDSRSSYFLLVRRAAVRSTFLSNCISHGSVGSAVLYFGHIMSVPIRYNCVLFVIAGGKRLQAGKPIYTLISICGLFPFFIGFRSI